MDKRYACRGLQAAPEVAPCWMRMVQSRFEKRNLIGA
jgi:hypothetical protein